MSRLIHAPRLKEDDLNKQLYGFQIFFIIISGVVGSGIFSNNGEALEVAGPAGLIISIISMGFIAICFGECAGELSQKFPVYNAMVEYVRVFVDEDLAFVVGIAYWYSYASFFANSCLAAANLSGYWNFPDVWRAIVFYFFAPVIILIINWIGVFYYGWIETVGGALKILLVVGTTIFLYVIAGKDSNDYITDGLQHAPEVIDSNANAVLYTFPITAYGFLGLEILTVTAYEARNVATLKWPSLLLPFVVFAMYLSLTIGEALNVSWLYPQLPAIYSGIGAENSTTLANPPSTSVVIIAAWNAGYHTFGGFLNGCLIFSALSTANTSLYVASRSLFGLTRNLRKKNSTKPIIKFLRSFSLLDRNVPVVALCVSWASFLWLPFLQLVKKFPAVEFMEIMSVSGSVACIIVWGSVCLAFIRYESWTRTCSNDLKDDFNRLRYYRRSESYGAWTFMFAIQPFPAYLGLLGCGLVIASASASWWSSGATFGKVAIAYAAPVIFSAIFLITKLYRRRLFKRWWVKLDPNVGRLIETLDNLELNRPEPRSQIELNAIETPEEEPEVVHAEVQTVVSAPENASGYDREFPDAHDEWPIRHEAERRW